jgi:hypothetical protein
VRARLVDTELKVKEVEELEAKLEEMAEGLERRNGYGSTG